MRSLGTATLIVVLTVFASAKQPQAECQDVMPERGFDVNGWDMRSVGGEKYKRPPMVAFLIREDGSVSKGRLVRHSGSREVDEKFLLSVSQWKYRSIPGCEVMKVQLAAGFIPDAEAAIKVAEPELIRIYGAHMIKSERPITAGLLG